MYQKILLAVDGSLLSQKVVEWARKAYRQFPDTQFVFTYVHQPYVATKPIGYLPVSYEYEQMDLTPPEITPASEATLEFPNKNRVGHKTLVGHPGEELNKEAVAGGYDLVVLGSKGHGVVSSVLLGSVSAKVLHNAPCSVLVLR